MKLTENQESFLLSFFKNDEYVGWKNIAKQLLRKGSCIVAGEKNIWVGGIGNFIKTKNADNLVDCLQYEFDLNNFLTSEWYKQTHNQYSSELYDKKVKINDEYDEIMELQQQ